jgi:hypothetical protein
MLDDPYVDYNNNVSSVDDPAAYEISEVAVVGGNGSITLSQILG